MHWSLTLSNFGLNDDACDYEENNHIKSKEKARRFGPQN